MPKGKYVNEDLPNEWMESQHILRPVMKQALKLDQYKGRVKLKNDKMVINGVQYGVDELHKIPKEIDVLSSCQKMTMTQQQFFDPHSEKNMHQAHFTADNQLYKSSEQYIQHKKAELFKDDVIANKILNSKSPFEAKRLSRKIKNFDMDKWRQNAQAIAAEGVYRKFSQNEILKMLNSTKATKIVEASSDRMWGTGVPLSLNSDNTLMKNTGTIKD